MPAALLFLVLAQEPIPPPMTPLPPDAGAPVPAAEPAPEPASPRVVTLAAGAEWGVTSWPEGSPQDMLVFVRPLLVLEAADAFVFEAGATFNLLVFDEAPVNRPAELGGVLRRADWDELSDFGQLIRRLRIAKEGNPAWVRAGPVRLLTLGNGHVINRYSNQDSPNYHPAAATGGLLLGPVRGELFVSDLLGARIFGGLVGLELGRLLASDPAWHDRFWLTLELAHDFANAGGPLCPDDDTVPGCPAGHRRTAPSLSVLHSDFSVMLLRAAAVRVQALVGLGARVGPRTDPGALAGLSAEADLGGFQLGAKLEARKQAGAFRHGIFGPHYELSRFAGAGLSGAPLADQLLPDGWSLYGELRAGSRGFLVAEAAVEHFFFGRTDVDVTLQAELFASRVTASLRFTGVALGVFPRYAVTGEVRARVFRSLYVLAAGGTAFFPQPDASLRRGVFATAGLGVDFDTGAKL